MTGQSFTRAILVLALLFLMACSGSSEGEPENPADIVFVGDHIMTVDPGTAGAEAVAVRGDTIVAVGSEAKIRAHVGAETRVVELGAQALLPGFIDTHGHITMLMRYLGFVNVSSPPVGPAETIDDVVTRMAEGIAQKGLEPGEWAIGYGYDDSLLAENRHPNRDDLDRASKQHPIVLIHVSGHLAAANSAALAAVGFDDSTPNPPGGVIRRRPGTNTPNGVLEENAGHALVMQHYVDSVKDDYEGALRRAIAVYASQGITTIQDGASNPGDIAAIRAIAAGRPLEVDVVAYPAMNAAPVDTPLDSVGFSPGYAGGFRVGGVKLVIDGSPQGRTAWMSEPYLEGPPGKGDDYVAYPIVEPAAYKGWAQKLITGSVPMIVHANGDAAIELMIDGVAEAVGDRRPDHRSVAIHAQLIRPDQLDRVADLGVVPSYLGAHPFFWGDWHRKSFGDARALKISPMRSTIERGIHFTIHNDAPVVPPDMMRLLWIMVNRETRSGFVLGADERGTVEEAVYAVTQGAAYQYFEEDRKGSITVGKQADLVVLGSDPRKVPSGELAEVPIIETFARGESVFARAE